LVIHRTSSRSSPRNSKLRDLALFFERHCPRRVASAHGVELASETVVGQRSNTNPFLAPGGQSPSPFAGATTMPQPSPVAMATAAPADTASDVTLNDVRLPADDATHDDAAPSRQDLLQRAAELGPSRMTWESFALQPADPVLGEKMQPRVVERRARFRRVVKVALGACVAFCLVATAVSAVSSAEASSPRASGSAKTAPATGVVTVEKLDVAQRTKAPKPQARATAARPAPKLGKRR
jgi:hypothetical protein